MIKMQEEQGKQHQDPSDAWLGTIFQTWGHKGHLVFTVCTVVPPDAHGVPVDGEVGPDGPPMEHQGPRPAGHRAILSLLIRPCNKRKFQDFKSAADNNSSVLWGFDL